MNLDLDDASSPETAAVVVVPSNNIEKMMGILLLNMVTQKLTPSKTQETLHVTPDRRIEKEEPKYQSSHES